MFKDTILRQTTLDQSEVVVIDLITEDKYQENLIALNIKKV